MADEQGAIPDTVLPDVRAFENAIVAAVAEEVQGAEWEFMDAAIRTGVRKALAALTTQGGAEG